jgi:hypothetical protein
MRNRVRSVDDERRAIVRPSGAKIHMKQEPDGQAALVSCRIEDGHRIMVAIFLIRYADRASIGAERRHAGAAAIVAAASAALSTIMQADGGRGKPSGSRRAGESGQDMR